MLAKLLFRGSLPCPAPSAEGESELSDKDLEKESRGKEEASTHMVVVTFSLPHR